jgi:hypothetical protein
MRSAILNSALSAIAENTNSGFWLSITHFSLAWASEAEKTANPVSASMTEVIQQTPSDGKVKGDYIYNIWQTPFAYDQYAGSFFNLDQSFARYFQYEYDTCNYRNVLQCNQNQSSGSWPSDLAPHFPFGTKLYGYINPSAGNPTPTEPGSTLTEANIPYYLDYSVVANQQAGVTTFSKLFPIKAYHLISQDDSNGTITVNYNLNLPAISSSIADQINFYANSIGNFKFNRIGLYMTVCAKQDPTTSDNPKDVYIPVANQAPVLFAVIDIGVDSCTGNDVRFDIYKTRDDSGFAGWDFDAQLAISTSNLNTLVQTFTTFYVDAMRDDATKYYQAQMMNNASLAQTVMQLQMMVLQLATAFEQNTGLNPFTTIKVAGYNVEASLGVDQEYFISKGSSNNRMLLDGLGFRGVNELGINYTNSSNALFSLKSYSSNNNVNEGELIKITVYNLDGRFITVAGNDVSWWNGSILFANYDETNKTKTKIFEINSELIKGLGFAKVTVLFSYSASLQKWVLESLSVIDETNLIS